MCVEPTLTLLYGVGPTGTGAIVIVIGFTTNHYHRWRFAHLQVLGQRIIG